MNKTFSILTIVAGVLSAPVAAHAASAWHEGNGNMVQFTPHHIGSQPRTEVQADTRAAREGGTLSTYQRAIPVPGKSSASPKTRAEVIEEMRTQSPEARQAYKALYGG